MFLGDAWEVYEMRAAKAFVAALLIAKLIEQHITQNSWLYGWYALKVPVDSLETLEHVVIMAMCKFYAFHDFLNSQSMFRYLNEGGSQFWN
jgi:uncharacterized membrane protein